MSKVLDSRFSLDIEHCYKPLTRDQEIVAIRKAKLGDTRATDALVFSQIKMIVSIARGYASHKHHIDDLVNDGVTGLIENINGYDETFDTKFMTYIARHVTNAITYRVYDDGLVRMPRNKSKQKEINTVYDADGYIIKEGIKKEIVVGVSIDAPVNNTENAPSFESFIVDEDNTPEDQFVNNHMSMHIKKMLHTLSDNERKIVSLSYGFDNYEPMTFQEIGDAMGKSKQAINMQMAKIIQKIKHNAKYIR